MEIRGSAPSPAGPVAGRITWIGDRGRVYRLGNLAQGVGAERALARGDVFTRSFRPLAPEDRAGIRVQRLRLATAHEGESLADFSHRTGNDWDAQRTAIANGLFASARLDEGQLLKIAVLEAYAGERATRTPSAALELGRRVAGRASAARSGVKRTFISTHERTSAEGRSTGPPSA